MNQNVAIVAAGATFAFTVIAGMLIGIWLSGRTGQSLWVLGGLGIGVIAGSAGAWRLVSRSLQ